MIFLYVFPIRAVSYEDFQVTFIQRVYLKVMFMHRLLANIVIECWIRVREVPGSIPSQGPRLTKHVIKVVPVVPLFSTEHAGL